jgi:two-component system, OmpR family, sensor histidine kinase VicK
VEKKKRDRNNHNNKEVIIIRIKDTGSRIDSNILQRLFEKFVSKSHKGTGLGLFSSKDIIEDHGGKIWVENNSDGEGATFAFSLLFFLDYCYYFIHTYFMVYFKL